MLILSFECFVEDKNEKRKKNSEILSMQTL